MLPPHTIKQKRKPVKKSPRIRRSQIRLFKFNLFLFVRMFPAMYFYTENALGDWRNRDHIEASYNTDSKQTTSPRPAVGESQVETTTRGSLRQFFVCFLFGLTNKKTRSWRKTSLFNSTSCLLSFQSFNKLFALLRWLVIRHNVQNLKKLVFLHGSLARRVTILKLEYTCCTIST